MLKGCVMIVICHQWSGLRGDKCAIYRPSKQKEHEERKMGKVSSEQKHKPKKKQNDAQGITEKCDNKNEKFMSSV
jgi:hypothetical protein